jgi:hypothetical protein
MAVMNQPPSRSRFLLVPDPSSAVAGDGRPKVRRYCLTRLQLGAPAVARATASSARPGPDSANFDSL